MERLATKWVESISRGDKKKIFIDPRTFKNENGVTISYFNGISSERPIMMVTNKENGNTKFFCIKNYKFLEKNFQEKVKTWLENGINAYKRANIMTFSQTECKTCIYV